jgi:Ser-tRNA(Ala) deacylase AlaX
LGGSVRLIRFEREGFEPVPCSGTHVTNSALIKPIKIKKIKVIQEKRSIRVTYLLT